MGSRSDAFTLRPLGSAPWWGGENEILDQLRERSCTSGTQGVIVHQSLSSCEEQLLRCVWFEAALCMAGGSSSTMQLFYLFFPACIARTSIPLTPDLQPENFLLGPAGTPKEKKLYLVDLGLGGWAWWHRHNLAAQLCTLPVSALPSAFHTTHICMPLQCVADASLLSLLLCV